MKCRVCGKQANIRLPQYNRALCSDDFILFFEKRVAATVRKYRLIGEEEKTLVAVSGGKDSLSLWQLLNRLGFSADGIYIDLGIHEYSRVSFEKTKAMAERLGRTLYSFSPGGGLHKRDQRSVRGHEEAALLSLWNDQEVCNEQGMHRTWVFGPCDRPQP